MTNLPLVVGGAGFIGSALTRLLAKRGPVRVLDDLSTGHKANVADVPGVDLRVGSILEARDVDESLDGVDVVFHLACLGVRHSIGRPWENHEVNASGTLRLLEAARRAGVQRFVYTSTSEVYGTAERVPIDEDHPAWPHTVYGGGKLAGEAYVRAYHRTYDFPTVVLRPFNAFGPRSHHEGDSGEVIPKFLVRLMNGERPVVFGDGTQTRDFTFVDDTARGISMAAESDAALGETINLGSGSEITVAALARTMAEVVGRPDLEPEFVAPRPGDVLRLLAASGRAERLLGWRAEVSLEEGVRRLVAWHGEQGTDWTQAAAEEVPINWDAAPR